MDAVKIFLNSDTFAVCGASRDRSKYGNIVFRRLLESGRTTYPINPSVDSVEGQTAFRSLSSLPVVPDAVSMVTPPAVTRQVIEEAIRLGVKSVWMQPGAEDAEASRLAREAGLTVIDDGSCILVLLSLESRNR